MEKLKILKISWCLKLIKFPEIQANMDSLEKLSLCQVGIKVIPSSVGKYCTNLISLQLEVCSKLRSIEGSFHALQHLQTLEVSGFRNNLKLPKDLFNKNCCLKELCLRGMWPYPYPKSSLEIPDHLPRFLRGLEISSCNLKDRDIPSNIDELLNLQELDLRQNPFSGLHLRLSQLTRLKVLNLTNCHNLVELPELPSSIAILKADWCKSLVAVGNSGTNFKWLREVSLVHVGNNVTGGDRLLQSMLQGNAVENHSMTLHIDGLEIPKGFTPSLLRKGRRCRLQLPENWSNHFSGFLMCAALKKKRGINPRVIIRHEKDDSMRTEYSEWEEGEDDAGTWVGYVSFGSLRHTTWWHHHSPSNTTPSFYIDFKYKTCRGFGVRLIPRKSESCLKETATTTTTSEFYDGKYDYTQKFIITQDSESKLELELELEFSTTWSFRALQQN